MPGDIPTAKGQERISKNICRTASQVETTVTILKEKARQDWRAFSESRVSARHPNDHLGFIARFIHKAGNGSSAPVCVDRLRESSARNLDQKVNRAAGEHAEQGDAHYHRQIHRVPSVQNIGCQATGPALERIIGKLVRAVTPAISRERVSP